MQRIFIIFLFVILSTSASAQISVGIRQGLSNRGLYIEPPILQSKQTAFWRYNAGVVFSFVNFGSTGFQTGLQTELNYAQKGWQEVDDTVQGSYFKRKIDYLEIPVLTHFEIGSKAFRILMLAGPYIGVKLSESSDSANFSHIYKLYGSYNHYSQKVKDIDIGVKLGVGFRYNIGEKFGVYAEWNYTLDFAGGNDIFINRPNDIQASRLKEMGLSLGVLWHIFPAKKPKADYIDTYIPKQDLYD